MPKNIDGLEVLSASEVADLVGVHRLTLLRWIREGKIQDAPRDRNGWRVFPPEVVAQVKAYAFSLAEPVTVRHLPVFRRAVQATSSAGQASSTRKAVAREES